VRKNVGWIVCLALLGLSHIASASSLSQLISQARTLALDGSSTSRQRFTDSQITAFINEGQREVLAASAQYCLKKSIQFQLQVGTTYYPLPSDFLSVNRLTIGYKYLQEMSPAALDGRSRGWQTASGYPTYYFVNFSSPSYIGFAPWPAQSTDTDTIRVEYNIQAQELVSGSDIPFNGVYNMYDYHHMLAYFAAMMMSAIDGQIARQQAYQAVYVGMATALNKKCVDRPNYLPSGTGTP